MARQRTCTISPSWASTPGWALTGARPCCARRCARPPPGAFMCGLRASPGGARPALSPSSKRAGMRRRSAAPRTLAPSCARPADRRPLPMPGRGPAQHQRRRRAARGQAMQRSQCCLAQNTARARRSRSCCARRSGRPGHTGAAGGGAERPSGGASAGRHSCCAAQADTAAVQRRPHTMDMAEHPDGMDLSAEAALLVVCSTQVRTHASPGRKGAVVALFTHTACRAPPPCGRLHPRVRPARATACRRARRATSATGWPAPPRRAWSARTSPSARWATRARPGLRRGLSTRACSGPVRVRSTCRSHTRTIVRRSGMRTPRVPQRATCPCSGRACAPASAPTTGTSARPGGGRAGRTRTSARAARRSTRGWRPWAGGASLRAPT